jgi:glycosyltransferase involved in cell wall biosynthesis
MPESVGKPACILFLLDWRPTFWSTREEFFCRLAQRLKERAIVPVITTSEPVTEEVRRRFEGAGARLIACSYHAHPFRYWSHIRQMGREYSLSVAHVRFFDYFTFVFWMCRLSGIRNVIFTEANSGERKGRGWKLTLLRLRTAIMCHPLTRLIAISEFIRGRLVDLGVPAPKILVVYNGVDTSSFKPNPALRTEVRALLGATPDTFVMAYASALLAWKRPEIALRVCAELVRKKQRVQLWVAGEGPLRGYLEALSKNLGITDNVRWLGQQPDLQRWLAGADVFLHTSLGEAFGNVLIEAMACGLPVVATDSGATPELIKEGETGCLIPKGPQEIEQFASTIRQLGDDRLRLETMARAAITSVGRFDVQDCVDRTLAVYDQVLVTFTPR